MTAPTALPTESTSDSDGPPSSLFLFAAAVAWQLPRVTQIAIALWVTAESWRQLRAVQNATDLHLVRRIRARLTRSSFILGALGLLALASHLLDLLVERWQLPLASVSVAVTIATTVCWYAKRPIRSRAIGLAGIEIPFGASKPLSSIVASVNKFLERQWVDRLLKIDDGHPNGLMTLALLAVIVSGIGQIAQTQSEQDIGPISLASWIIEEVGGNSAPVSATGGEHDQLPAEEATSGSTSDEVITTEDLEPVSPKTDEGADDEAANHRIDCEIPFADWLADAFLDLERPRRDFDATVEEFDYFGPTQLGCPTSIVEEHRIVIIRLEGGIGGDTALVLDETNDPAVVFADMVPTLDERSAVLRQVGDRTSFDAGRLYRFVYEDYSCGLFVDVFGVTDGFVELPPTVARLVSPLAAELEAVPYLAEQDGTVMTVGLIGIRESADGSMDARFLDPIRVTYDAETRTASLDGVGRIDTESDWCHPAMNQIELIAQKLAE